MALKRHLRLGLAEDLIEIAKVKFPQHYTGLNKLQNADLIIALRRYGPSTANEKRRTISVTNVDHVGFLAVAGRAPY